MKDMVWLRNFMGGGILPEIMTKVVTITPEVARMLLEHNTRNPRKANRSVVMQYARDMCSGNWQLNGEPIVIDRDGNLKNGQHRCLACIESGCAFETLIVYGVESEQNLYDMQYRRNLTQEMGVPKDWGYITSIMVTDAYRERLIPNGVSKQYIQTHAEQLDRTCMCCRFGGCSASPRSRKRDVMASAYLILRSGADEDKVKDFFYVVNSGFNIDGVECSPAIVYAKFIDAMKNSSKLRGTVMYRIETFIRAYSDFQSGVRRRVAYRVNSTENAENMLRLIRIEDGLE